MKKGSITIYLSMVLMVLIALFVTCIEGARIEATKLKFSYAADSAATSCFAEYRKELFDKYDLLFVDVSYGGCCTDLSLVENRVEENFTENCVPEKGLPLFFRKTVLGFDETDVVIQEIQVATDEDGEVFKEAATSYIKSKYGVAEIEILRDEVQEYEDAGYFSSKVEEDRIANEEKIEETAVIPGEETVEGEVTWEKIEVNNPADMVNNTRTGVLNLVLEEIDQVSPNMVELSSYASKRVNSVGTMANNTEGNNNAEQTYLGEDAIDEFFFSEYILEKSGDYTSAVESDFLRYECEYIIAGKESDIENLRNVVNRILLIRETSNVAHILADTTKMEQLELLSVGLAAVTTVPELQPIIKYSLLLAWGYAEAVSDVKRLLKGGKVAFYKTADEWTLSLENMLSFTLAEEDKNDANGISYQQYLRMLVYIENPRKKVYRMMDVVEMQIRSLGYLNFRIDTCVNVMEFEFVALDKNGKIYKEKKRQYY